jgi:hypothetical protein
MLDGLDISLDINTAGTVDETIVPVSIMDVAATAGCDCETCSTDFEDINTAQPQAPDLVFARPTFRILTVTPPMGDVSSPLAFTSEFVQNNAGLHTAVRAYIDGVLTDTDILFNRNFLVTLPQGGYTLKVEVDYLQGPDITDSTGQIIHNPIVAGTLVDSTFFEVMGAVFTGACLDIPSIPNILDGTPQNWPAQLSTGTTGKCFWIAFNSNLILYTAVDKDTAFIPIDMLFNYVKNITMPNGTIYTVLAMVNAIPYVTNHTFELQGGFD